MVGCTHVGSFYELKNESRGKFTRRKGLQNYSISFQLEPGPRRLGHLRCTLRRISRNRSLTHSQCQWNANATEPSLARRGPRGGVTALAHLHNNG